MNMSLTSSGTLKFKYRCNGKSDAYGLWSFGYSWKKIPILARLNAFQPILMDFALVTCSLEEKKQHPTKFKFNLLIKLIGLNELLKCFKRNKIIIF